MQPQEQSPSSPLPAPAADRGDATPQASGMVRADLLTKLLEMSPGSRKAVVDLVSQVNQDEEDRDAAEQQPQAELYEEDDDDPFNHGGSIDNTP